jgi:hypothetical protein
MGLLSTPIGLGAKAIRGLMDMSTPARMARAKEQGFDVDNPVYHGTNVEFDSFDANLGNQRDIGFYGSGNYFSPDKEVAEGYAGSLVDDTEIGDVNVVKAMLNYKKPFIWDKENPDALLSLLNDAGVRSPYVDNIANSRDLRAFDKYLKDNGHDAVIVKNRFGDIDEVMVPSSSQIRSPDAAFDPAKISSSNLLASNPVATTGAGLMANVTGQPSNLSSYMQGNTDAYLTNAERQYLQNKQAFESNFSDDTGWDRADILPFRVNEQTGEREFATPEMIKGLLSGLYDIGQSKNTKISNPASLLELI